MKTAKILVILTLALSTMVCPTTVMGQVPLGTAFTYQGFLVDNKKPAEGQYDFQFTLYNDPCTDTQEGDTIVINALDVNDGYFAVDLDFGGDVFTGDARWLGIAVRRTNSGDPFTDLHPRVSVTLTPYALYALGSEDANTLDGYDATAFAPSIHDHDGVYAPVAHSHDDRYYTETELQTSGLANIHWDNLLATMPNDFADGVDNVGSVPSGIIVMWSGSSIPAGWALCDGNNNTPDLRDRFIVGTGNSYNVNDTGGEVFHKLTIDEMPSHSHPGLRTEKHVGDASAHDYDAYKCRADGTTGIAGGDQPHENRPPYYALAFIMKL